MLNFRTYFRFFLVFLFLSNHHMGFSQGFYFGSSFSNSEADYGSDIILSAGATLDDQESGYKIFGGYRANSLLSIEGHYADFGELVLVMPNGASITQGALTSTNTTGVASSTRLEPTSLGLSAILTAPFETVQPYLKVGIHQWDTSRVVSTGSATIFATEIDGTDVLRGVGFDIPVTYLFSTRLEYEVYDFDDDKLTLLNWGVFIKF